MIMDACADMAELVDALVSGTSGSNALEVRVFLSAPDFWGCSSVDRALRSHRRGRGFESHQLHQDKEKAGVSRFFYLSTLYQQSVRHSTYLQLVKFLI